MKTCSVSWIENRYLSTLPQSNARSTFFRIHTTKPTWIFVSLNIFEKSSRHLFNVRKKKSANTWRILASQRRKNVLRFVNLFSFIVFDFVVIVNCRFSRCSSDWQQIKFMKWASRGISRNRRIRNRCKLHSVIHWLIDNGWFSGCKRCKHIPHVSEHYAILRRVLQTKPKFNFLVQSARAHTLSMNTMWR